MARNFIPIFGLDNIFLGYATRAYGVYGQPLGVDFSSALTKRILHDSNLFIPAEVDSWPYEPFHVRHGVCPISMIINNAKIMNLAYKVQLRETKWGIEADEYELSSDRVYLPFSWARYGMPIIPLIDDGVGEDGLVRDEPVPKRETDSDLRLRNSREDLTGEENGRDR
jgi:hypothetical protein